MGDDFDPWSDTNSSASEPRDDPFEDWPTESPMGEITGPHSYEGLVARAARGGAPPSRRLAAWVGGVSLLILVLSMLIVGLV